MNFTRFDWDEGNRAKCIRHGVSISEIEALFIDGPRVSPDLRHSIEEQRFIAAGEMRAGRPLFVAFTFRGRASELVRPVSARYTHRKEADRYGS